MLKISSLSQDFNIKGVDPRGVLNKKNEISPVGWRIKAIYLRAQRNEVHSYFHPTSLQPKYCRYQKVAF